jgi:hypothetical protein
MKISSEGQKGILISSFFHCKFLQLTNRKQLRYCSHNGNSLPIVLPKNKIPFPRRNVTCIEAPCHRRRFLGLLPLGLRGRAFSLAPPLSAPFAPVPSTAAAAA